MPAWSVSRRAGESTSPNPPITTVTTAWSSSTLWEVGVMFERGRLVSGVVGLGDPELDAVQLAEVAGAFFGVGHAVAGGHEVELTRRDHLLGAE